MKKARRPLRFCLATTFYPPYSFGGDAVAVQRLAEALERHGRRLERAQDWIDAGFAEYFGGAAVCLVEWPAKAGGTLPPADIDIHLDLAGDAREARLVASSPAGRRCLSALGP